MKLVYIVAGAEVLLGIVTGIYLLAGLALSVKTVPIWLAGVVAATYWIAFYELVRHARELVRKQRRLNQ